MIMPCDIIQYKQVAVQLLTWPLPLQTRILRQSTRNQSNRRPPVCEIRKGGGRGRVEEERRREGYSVFNMRTVKTQLERKQEQSVNQR